MASLGDSDIQDAFDTYDTLDVRVGADKTITIDDQEPVTVAEVNAKVNEGRNPSSRRNYTPAMAAVFAAMMYAGGMYDDNEIVPMRAIDPTSPTGTWFVIVANRHPNLTAIDGSNNFAVVPTDTALALLDERDAKRLHITLPEDEASPATPDPVSDTDTPADAPSEEDESPEGATPTPAAAPIVDDDDDEPVTPTQQPSPVTTITTPDEEDQDDEPEADTEGTAEEDVPTLSVATVEDDEDEAPTFPAAVSPASTTVADDEWDDDPAEKEAPAFPTPTVAPTFPTATVADDEDEPADSAADPAQEAPTFPTPTVTPAFPAATVEDNEPEADAEHAVEEDVPAFPAPTVAPTFPTATTVADDEWDDQPAASGDTGAEKAVPVPLSPASPVAVEGEEDEEDEPADSTAAPKEEAPAFPAPTVPTAFPTATVEENESVAQQEAEEPPAFPDPGTSQAPEMDDAPSTPAFPTTATTPQQGPTPAFPESVVEPAFPEPTTTSASAPADEGWDGEQTPNWTPVATSEEAPPAFPAPAVAPQGQEPTFPEPTAAPSEQAPAFPATQQPLPATSGQGVAGTPHAAQPHGYTPTGTTVDDLGALAAQQPARDARKAARTKRLAEKTAQAKATKKQKKEQAQAARAQRKAAAKAAKEQKKATKEQQDTEKQHGATAVPVSPSHPTSHRGLPGGISRRTALIGGGSVAALLLIGVGVKAASGSPKPTKTASAAPTNASRPTGGTIALPMKTSPDCLAAKATWTKAIKNSTAPIGLEKGAALLTDDSKITTVDETGKVVSATTVPGDAQAIYVGSWDGKPTLWVDCTTVIMRFPVDTLTLGDPQKVNVPSGSTVSWGGGSPLFTLKDDEKAAGVDKDGVYTLSIPDGYTATSADDKAITFVDGAGRWLRTSRSSKVGSGTITGPDGAALALIRTLSTTKVLLGWSTDDITVYDMATNSTKGSLSNGGVSSLSTKTLSAFLGTGVWAFDTIVIDTNKDAIYQAKFAPKTYDRTYLYGKTQDGTWQYQTLADIENHPLTITAAAPAIPWGGSASMSYVVDTKGATWGAYAMAH